MRGVENIPSLYDPFCRLLEAFGLGRWRRWVAEGARGRTLEVGVGTGRNLPLYPDEVFVVGLDRDASSLDAARERAGGRPLVLGDAQALPFRDGAFDTVVSSLVFCTVPDPGLGLAEVRRVLGPAGELRMLEHVRSTLPLLAKGQDWIQPAWSWLSGGCHPNRDTEGMVEEAGFAIDRSTRKARRGLRRFVARPPG